ncbi:hypothetical protein [Stygiolobus azoricus]|uniref:Uncharacterized protein n=1 Tax=Stygiolobus azoricus TaxID=41675 RepID=A0A650CP75_9CREN|nr:hypothetical protein [Stygiolobus azoricus]QGR19588.1 hypothetical protein D1868_06005 [Stygiolobus azoricus]
MRRVMDIRYKENQLSTTLFRIIITKVIGANLNYIDEMELENFSEGDLKLTLEHLIASGATKIIILAKYNEKYISTIIETSKLDVPIYFVEEQELEDDKKFIILVERVQ